MTVKQAEFQIRYIWWAISLAIFAGFALGAHVASVIGFDFPLGKGFYSYVQMHGHIQLIGWAGLFIIGISLHFIPRLAGVPLSVPGRINRILWLISSGLILRFLSHSLLPYLEKDTLFTPVNILVSLSGLMVWFGVLLYLTTIVQTIQSVQNLNKRPALKSVKPFFVIMLLGWLLYPTLNLILLLHMTRTKAVILNQAWNEFNVQIFINLVLLPVAFAFSVRMFPLYLRLPAIDWSVRGLAYAYFAAVCLQLLPTLPPILASMSNLPLTISNIGMTLKGSVILWFVWKLDLLTRRRDPWTVHRKLHPGPERHPTRNGLPDYGEFGRFERLVYSSYIWLILGATLEIILGASFLFDLTVRISSDALRHIYLLGFITQLILGMSVRMIPGFINKKRVARPKLVDATFWLSNVAAASRVFPLIIPAAVLQTIPGAIAISQGAFALSGVFGIAAVIHLGINLLKTSKMEE